MKKFYLSLLASFFCCLSMFAIDGQFTFTAHGDSYNDVNKTFKDKLTLFVSWNDVIGVSGTNFVKGFDQFAPDEVEGRSTPRGGMDTIWRIYVTVDGSDPADKDNSARQLVWDILWQSIYTKPVEVTSTSVVRAALVWQNRPYSYKQTSGNIITGYTYTKEIGDLGVENVGDRAFQSYICLSDAASAAPTVEMVESEGSVCNTNINAFINNAKVSVASNFTIPEGLEDYFDTYMVYSTNGVQPTVSDIVSESSNITKLDDDSDFKVYDSSDIYAAQVICAKYYSGIAMSNTFGFYTETNEPCLSPATALNVKKVELTSADGVVFEHDHFVGDDQAFVLTWGVNVKNIKYNGNTYSVLTDGKSSFLVKNGGFKEEQVYYVGGNYAWYSDLCMPMFEKDFYYSIGYYNEYIKLAPTMLSEDNMISFIRNQNTQPLVNVGFLVEDFDAETGTATVGGQTVEIVNAADIAAAIPTDKPSLYNGDATITGIIFGHPYVSDKILVYADAITQGPQLTVSAPKITLEKEKNVDSTKDLTVTVCFDDYEIINPDLDAAEVELYGNAQLRTVDGKAIGDPIPYEAQKLGEPFELTIGREQITPDLAYIITIDGVTAQTTPILYETEFDNASKSFVTKAPAILNQSVSVFDGVVTATVLNVETVGINDESEIKLYNNATGEEVEYEAIDASGNKIYLTVGEGGFSSDVPFVTGLNFGQYTLILGPEALTVDEFINPKELRFEITAGDETDKARIDALTDINRCWTLLQNAPVGVNIFQYLPATVEKFQAAVAEALAECMYESNPLAAADNIRMANDKLLKALYCFRPTLPEGNKTYTIRTNYNIWKDGANMPEHVMGKYLNIDGEKVALSDTPSYIQFHMVENCFDEYFDALVHMDPNDDIRDLDAYKYTYNPDYGHFSSDRFNYTPYTWYIYNTKNRKYVYSEVQIGHDEEEDYDYPYFTLTDNRHLASTFSFHTGDFNEWFIDATLADKQYAPIAPMLNSKHYNEGIPVIYFNDDVLTYDDDPAKGSEELYEFANAIDYKFTWFIAQEDEPEPEPLNIPEGYIALTDEADLEGQTVVLMNVETEQFLYGPNAQNTGVADFETATASTNVVTAYKIEKADNGFLFRCVTPAGGDYGLWGSNPCYLNSQPNAGGVSFNLGKDQDIANGSTWSLTYDEDARAWIFQSVANNAYLAGTTVSADLTAKWVICGSTAETSGADDATAISSIETANNAAAIYNAAGARANALQKGINIVKMADGSVRKVYVK